MPGAEKINQVDPAKILLYPVGTEKAMRLLEQNIIVFVVDKNAKKPDIKRAFENAFNVKVKKVNTLIDRNGNKKAYIRLSDEANAFELATTLGLM